MNLPQKLPPIHLHVLSDSPKFVPKAEVSPLQDQIYSTYSQVDEFDEFDALVSSLPQDY